MSNLYINTDHDWKIYNDFKKEMRYFYTGYGRIDSAARPRSGHVTIIGAPTNHGKSILLKNIAFNMFNFYKDMHFLYYSFEEVYGETADDLARMLHFSEFEKYETAIHRGSYDEAIKHETNELHGAHFGMVSRINKRMHITDRRISPEELKAHIEQCIHQFGNVHVVFIDYLQDMKPSRDKSEYHAEMEEMMEEVEEISRRYNLAIIIPAQFKQNKNAGDKWDLIGLDCFFGSHAIPKKADLVYSVFNNTVFDLRKDSSAEGYKLNNHIQKIEVDIIKQRKQNYATGIKMELDKRTGRITENDAE